MKKEYTIRELCQMNRRDFISATWGEEFLMVLDRQPKIYMTKTEFLTHCTACGGDWASMILSGINELFPQVYAAIPEDMGVLAINSICDTLILLGIDPNN